MVYENDTSAVRDARENLEDAEFEIQKQKLEDLKKPLEEQIELLEKRKELIQDEIDGYEKQQEALQKALERSNKYYDKLIKDTEEYWDGMIEKLEKTKSKFEELLELKELSNAYSLVNEFFKDFPYTLEDVVNDVPGAFDALLAAWEQVLLNANANTENFAQSLDQAKQDMTNSLGEMKTSASDTVSSLDPLAEALKPIKDSATDISNTANALGDVADNSEKIASNTDTAASNTSNLATSLGDISDAAPGAAQGIEDTATNIEKEGDAAKNAAPHKEAFAEANKKIAENAGIVATNVEKAADAIGTEGTNAENAYKSLEDISNVDLETIVTQVKNLAEALSDVATALGLSEESTVSALETAITNLSTMTLGDEETGIIGSFNALKNAVTGVTSAIGGGGSGTTSGGDGTTDKSASMSAGADDSGESGGLTSAIENLHETADTHIGTGAEEGGEEGGTVISDFSALKAAVDLVSETIGIAGENGEVSETSLLGVIQSMPEIAEEPLTTVQGFFESLQGAIASCVDAVVSLNAEIEKLGSSAGGAGFNFTGGEATGNVHIDGHAYANGKLGLKQSETALVGEVGQELVYNPKSGTYRTVGEHGPELTRLNKGDLVFNAKQTEAIIKNGKRDHGHSYADGNTGLMSLSADELNLFRKIGNAVTDMQTDISQMLEPVKSISQNVTNNTTNIAPTITISGTSFNVTGVTGEDVCHTIQDTFAGIISNAYQRAMT